ncbi:MAG: cytoplasmic protein [Desulfobacterales bacterium]
MFDEKEFNDVDLSVKQDNLYLEESFTDLDMASIRRLTPVKPNGLKDKTRKQIFVGHLNLMTPQGPIPIQAPLKARNLKEAMELYPEAIKTALKKMQEEIEKLQREQDSRIIVPGS